MKEQHQGTNSLSCAPAVIQLVCACSNYLPANRPKTEAPWGSADRSKPSGPRPLFTSRRVELSLHAQSCTPG